VASPQSPQEVVAEAEVEEEVEEAVEAEEEVEGAAEGYQQECHLLAEPHLFTESWEEIPQPNSTETGRRAMLFSSHSLSIEE